MQVNTVNVELITAKSHYVGYMHVTIYKTQLQCQNLNYLTLKSSIQNEWTLVADQLQKKMLHSVYYNLSMIIENNRIFKIPLMFPK
jgi:DMSO reductase anchor subunit